MSLFGVTNWRVRASLVQSHSLFFVMFLILEFLRFPYSLSYFFSFFFIPSIIFPFEGRSTMGQLDLRILYLFQSTSTLLRKSTKRTTLFGLKGSNRGSYVFVWCDQLASQGFISVVAFFLFCFVFVLWYSSEFHSPFPTYSPFFLFPLLFLFFKDVVQWVNSTSGYCSCRSRQVHVV